MSALHSRRQGPSEPVASFAKAIHCLGRLASAPDDHLRDFFMNGLTARAASYVQDKAPATFAQARDYAEAWEAHHKHEQIEATQVASVAQDLQAIKAHLAMRTPSTPVAAPIQQCPPAPVPARQDPVLQTLLQKVLETQELQLWAMQQTPKDNTSQVLARLDALEIQPSLQPPWTLQMPSWPD